MIAELLIPVRALHLATLMLLVGAMSFVLFVAQPIRAGAPDLFDGLDALVLRLAGWSIFLALLSGMVWVWLLAASMSGQSLGEAFRSGAIGTVLTRTNFGTVWVFRLAGAGLLAAGFLLAHRSLRENRRWPEFRAGAGLLGALLLVSLAGAGHASGTDQSLRTFNVAADGLHLLAGGVWLGALVPLACVVGRARVSAASATAVWNVARRFSVLGMASVGSILATGAINAWLLVGRLSALVGTGYGRLLLVKLALFATMVAIAAVNRFRLTPRLVPGTASQGPQRDAAARLRRNTVAELVLGTLIVLIVGALGIMVPPPHVHHH